MLIACQAKKSNAHKIPAVIHVDNSCRVQSVSKKINYKFWKLIQEFDKITKIPVILNTSFNIKGEPIVNTSEDAIRCFRKYNIDYLVLGSNLVKKDNNASICSRPISKSRHVISNYLFN